MNPLKNMEMIFGAVAAAALLFAAAPERDARAAAARSDQGAGNRVSQGKPTGAPPVTAIATPATMAVVVIKGKRLSAREKRRAALVESTIAAPTLRG